MKKQISSKSEANTLATIVPELNQTATIDVNQTNMLLSNLHETSFDNTHSSRHRNPASKMSSDVATIDTLTDDQTRIGNKNISVCGYLQFDLPINRITSDNKGKIFF